MDKNNFSQLSFCSTLVFPKTTFLRVFISKHCRSLHRKKEKEVDGERKRKKRQTSKEVIEKQKLMF